MKYLIIIDCTSKSPVPREFSWSCDLIMSAPMRKPTPSKMNCYATNMTGLVMSHE